MNLKTRIVASTVLLFALAVTISPFTNCSGFKAIQLENLSSSSSGTLGAAYFQNTVTPLLVQKCASCHKSGGVGPTTVVNYSSALALLTNGTNALNNAYINKTKNITAHGGGNLCPGDVNGSVSPCSEFKRWSVIENALSAVGPTGVINGVNPVGQISGWALDTQNAATTISVSVYADGPAGSGTSLGTFSANMAGVGAQQNGHYFNAQVSKAFLDGRSHQFYLYAGTASIDTQFSNAPFTTITYSGTQFYSAYVAPQVASCVGCHSDSSYTKWHAALASLNGVAGGTATSNDLINKASNTTTHGGGNRCASGINSDPCATFQNWWKVEFSP